MHIPDGFLDAKTVVASGLCGGAGLVWALAKAKRELPPRRVPLLGLGAAFLFAAQMINFPVMGGTSGHLLGGTLVACLLGVPAAVIVVSTVLIAQCFLFADGGVTALGANLFNLALVAPVVGFLGFGFCRRLFSGLRGQVIGVAFGAWCSTVAASIACAGQLAWSGTLAFSVSLPAMAGIHALIGVGEGLISGMAYYAIARSRPSLLLGGTEATRPGYLAGALLACLGLALFVAPFACPWPDGLDAVAQRFGFAHQAGEASTSVFSDYALPGVASPALATALAGALGTLVALLLAWLLGRLLVRSQKQEGAG